MSRTGNIPGIKKTWQILLHAQMYTTNILHVNEIIQYKADKKQK
jgi:hypothetical protein